MKRYPRSFPATRRAHQETLAQFGIGKVNPGPTPEEREMADGFDVKKALRKAKRGRSK